MTSFSVIAPLIFEIVALWSVDLNKEMRKGGKTKILNHA